MPQLEGPTWTVEDFRQALREPLPGLGAQLRMSPRPRPTRPWPPGHSPRRAGVLLLLYPDKGEWRFPLTLRTEGLATHQGQVSLPGGAWEPGDPNLQHTALRETEEELGVPAETLQVLGKLTPLYIPPSDFCIHPFVAVVDAPPAFQPDPTEVAQVLETPLRALLDPAVRQWEERPVRGVLSRIPYFAIGEHKVWGATAMVLAEFAACLERLR